jgi:deoxyribonuclease V
MKVHPLHAWDVTPTEAVALQRKLASQVVTDTPLSSCKLIAGADISYNRFSPIFFAGVVVLRTDDLSVVEKRGVRMEVTFPYVPGLLSFREGPGLLQAFAHVESKPDAVMCDGQGIAHPRGLGVASHLGLFLQVPCIGCAKSRLLGQYEDPGREAGSTSPLHLGDKVIGSVVRTKTGVQPVYVSPGNRINLESSIHWVLATCKGYRIPEPTRQAHLYVNRLRLGEDAL